MKAYQLIFLFIVSTIVKTAKVSEDELPEFKKIVFKFIAGVIEKYEGYQPADPSADVVPDHDPLIYNFEVSEGEIIRAFTISEVEEKEEGEEESYRLKIEKIDGIKIFNVLTVPLKHGVLDREAIQKFVHFVFAKFFVKMRQIPFRIVRTAKDIEDMINFVFVVKDDNNKKTEFLREMKELEDQREEKVRVYKMFIKQHDFESFDLKLEFIGEEKTIDSIKVSFSSPYFNLDYDFSLVTLPFIVKVIEARMLFIKHNIYDSMVEYDVDQDDETLERYLTEVVEDVNSFKDRLSKADDHNEIVNINSLILHKDEPNDLYHSLRFVNFLEIEDKIYSNSIVSAVGLRNSPFSFSPVFRSLKEFAILFIKQQSSSNLLRSLYKDETDETSNDFFGYIKDMYSPFMSVGNTVVEGDVSWEMDQVDKSQGDCDLCKKYVIYRMKKKRREKVVRKMILL